MAQRVKDQRTDALTITDLAIREGLGYQVARERALKGLFGTVARVGGRLYVTPTGRHERAKDQKQSPQTTGGGSMTSTMQFNPRKTAPRNLR